MSLVLGVYAVSGRVHLYIVCVFVCLLRCQVFGICFGYMTDTIILYIYLCLFAFTVVHVADGQYLFIFYISLYPIFLY